jgi:hypothetical protein
MAADLAMLPLSGALAALGDRPLRIRMLTPPYPALGMGALRCLRVRPLGGAHDGALELVAGYDGYERLP